MVRLIQDGKWLQPAVLSLDDCLGCTLTNFVSWYAGPPDMFHSELFLLMMV